MALTPPPSPNLLQVSVKSSSSPCLSPSVHYLLFGSPCANASPFLLQKSGLPLLPVAVKPSSLERRIKCFTTRSYTKEDRLNEPETFSAEDVAGGGDEDGGSEDLDLQQNRGSAVASPRIASSSSDSLSLGIREPVYEVLE
ncbi:hypothetical protein ES288_A13G259800v1 [Gossypium darwinii]|nr:hypothetical protein ES288_A13G259800v1 [Gossypium darwinii]